MKGRLFGQPLLIKGFVVASNMHPTDEFWYQLEETH
jgi:hypothetical protein